MVDQGEGVAQTEVTLLLWCRWWVGGCFSGHVSVCCTSVQCRVDRVGGMVYRDAAKLSFDRGIVCDPSEHSPS